MSDVKVETINELTDIFEKIHGILICEKEDNWIRGINSIRLRLKNTDRNMDLNRIFQDIRSSYKAMNKGQGSFNDFMIWRDDYDERLKINQEFEALASKAWTLLDL